jgi:hypothetical protein
LVAEVRPFCEHWIACQIWVIPIMHSINFASFTHLYVDFFESQHPNSKTEKDSYHANSDLVQMLLQRI